MEGRFYETKGIFFCVALLALVTVGAIYAASSSDIWAKKVSDTTFSVQNTATKKVSNATIAIDLITSKSTDGRSDVCTYYQTGTMKAGETRTVSLSDLGYGSGNKIYRVAVGSCYFDE